jgi:hypothetical protein
MVISIIIFKCYFSLFDNQPRTSTQIGQVITKSAQINMWSGTTQTYIYIPAAESMLDFNRWSKAQRE